MCNVAVFHSILLGIVMDSVNNVLILISYINHDLTESNSVKKETKIQVGHACWFKYPPFQCNSSQYYIYEFSKYTYLKLVGIDVARILGCTRRTSQAALVWKRPIRSKYL
uniref:Uncharacterized protein n=1 Tax=Glossina palpalis gambiensis TaxID=67801 RepID=A0A1B0ARG5_9MUSC